MSDQRHKQLAQCPLVITPGEPAGVGPELLIQIIQQQLDVPVVAIASKNLLESRAKQLGLPLTIKTYHPGETLAEHIPGECWLIDEPLSVDAKPGELNSANADYVISCLSKAIDGCMDNTFSGLVTGPLHKGIINEAGIPFSGHTEFLQERCEVSKVVMMLASPRMRVALASTHLPLKDVASVITHASLAEIISILISDLQTKFGIEEPRILVAGLNPHAGEGGHMGREEIEVIEPVMQGFENSPAKLIGPLPADTLFTPKYLKEADAVLAMFHDQGLPVLKYDGFGESVNITLGLPIIRTSVDHGTALDIAGQGIADAGSLLTAIRIASEMASSQLK